MEQDVLAAVRDHAPLAPEHAGLLPVEVAVHGVAERGERVELAVRLHLAHARPRIGPWRVHDHPWPLAHDDSSVPEGGAGRVVRLVTARPSRCSARRSTNSIWLFRLRRSSAAQRWSASSTAGSIRSRNAFLSATSGSPHPW